FTAWRSGSSLVQLLTKPSNGLRNVSRFLQRNAKTPPLYYAIVSGVSCK
ncbi:MAG: hypothetical protein ACJAS1_007172, partial [Oleiphilaceae bacterium]